jgi:glycosyltransferase involved in cell wall biosynthesis
VPRIIIGIISDLFHETRLRRMTDALEEQGYEVIIAALAGGPATLFTGHRVWRLPVKRRKGKTFFLEFMWQLYRFLGKNKADCLLAVDTPALLPMALAKRGRPLIYDSREFFTQMGTLQGRPWVSRFWRLAEGWGLRRTASWFSVCHSITRSLEQLYGVAGGGVVRNVSYQVATPPRSDYLRRRFRLSPEEFILLYQGGFWGGYDFRPLNQAVLSLEGVSLVYVGDGPELPPLQKWVDRVGGRERIFFHPKVAPEELLPITASAQAGTVLIPDRGLSYRYLLPNKLFEYLQARIPVVVSDFPELSALVRTYDVGETADPTAPGQIAQAVQKVRRRLAEDGYDRQLEKAAAELCWEKEKERFLEMVEAACGSAS